MILPSGVVIRIASFNMERCYFAVQNLNSTATDVIYVMQSEEEAETFKRAGFAIGGYGLFEMQNCLNPQSKKAWFAYQETGADVDIRVLDI
jgi:hypothetical protein